ncbi:hypothetical protein M422DRAFT_242887 [Sphaerobolus stellatus SS14]|nr:hypothetical protein M422DRAFT_242887 [Sphaerobolus stellatus SS14]
MEREVHPILGPVGVDEKISRQVIQCLRRVEVDPGGVGSTTFNREAGTAEEDSIPLNGVPPFGEGLVEVPTSRLYTSAFTIGMGDLVGGFVPLIPYFFTLYAEQALLWSSIITGIVLLIFGGVTAHVTGAAIEWKGYLRRAVSMLLVGGCAAGSAY